MIRQIYTTLLTVTSLCFAGFSLNGSQTSAPLFAYTPFHTDGLESRYKSKDHSIYAYAPATVYFNGAYHQFYCSNGQESDNYFNQSNNSALNKSLDHIRYRSSKDGVNWSAPRVVMTVSTAGSDLCACDPSIVQGDDGYWYMLYTGKRAKYESVVYLARSNYIQGPYFKYLENNKWENEVTGIHAPKIMLGTKTSKPYYGVGQQTVIKNPAGGFFVWFRSGTGKNHEKDLKFIFVNDLTRLKYDDSHDIRYFDNIAMPNDRRWKTFSEGPYELGDVRLNLSKTIATGTVTYEMWCIYGYMTIDFGDHQGNWIVKFSSTNLLDWEIVDIVNYYDLNTYGYYYIHNMGVSGDERGWITDEKYLISFSAPSPKRGTPEDTITQKALKADQKTLNNNGFNIPHKADMQGYWSMWQLFVGGDWWFDNEIHYPSNGTTFPDAEVSNDLEYFTGDYDGDGITDLGAVDRSSKKWYLFSSRRHCYMHWMGSCQAIGFGEILIPEMNENFEIITGDFDGDGKTDVGAVDKEKGLWYILSSADLRHGVYSSKNNPNWIPWGWQWGDMDKACQKKNNSEFSCKIIVGDYNGDGIADRAFYTTRKTNEKGRKWYIISSSAREADVAKGFYDVKAVAYFPFGWEWRDMTNSHTAVSGDFDGDGITDRAIFGNNQWFSLSSRFGEKPIIRKYYRSNDRYYGNEMWEFTLNLSTLYFSPASGTPIVGDFDGDGVSDMVQVNKSKGEWYIFSSIIDRVIQKNWSRIKNVSNAVLLTGDFDGDNISDLAFIDKSKRTFYVKSSRNNDAEGITFKIGSIPGKPFLAKSAVSAEEKKIEQPKSPVVTKAPAMEISITDRKVSVTNVESGSRVTVFNLLGKKIFSTIANENTVNFELPSRGKFVVRTENQSRAIMVK